MSSPGSFCTANRRETGKYLLVQSCKHVIFFPSRFINSHNRKHVSFQVGVNHLADRSPEELAVLRGRTHNSGYNGGLPFNPDLSTLKDVPDSMDWRLYGNKMLHLYCTDIPYVHLKQSK